VHSPDLFASSREILPEYHAREHRSVMSNDFGTLHFLGAREMHLLKNSI